jgi:hypothetical protein
MIIQSICLYEVFAILFFCMLYDGDQLLLVKERTLGQAKNMFDP